jgi:diadenosine tetraphosphatase ApaH/serine/threonine PP2A family protein phosphatase
MRILIISDIHANLTALEAVLNAADVYDAVWCLGDIVGYGPDPNECIERVQALPGLKCLLGNHDAAAIGEIDLEAFNRDAKLSANWTQKTVTEKNLSFLRSLPKRVTEGDVTLVHGSPRNPVWEYLLDPSVVLTNFGHFDTHYCLAGHTHLPILYFAHDVNSTLRWKVPKSGEGIKLNGRVILNPGSVGQPRDHNPRASFALFTPETNVWEPFRVDYDILSVQQRIRQAELPARHAARLAEGW